MSKSLADILREEGFEEGLKKGCIEGLKIGLVAKFKEVPTDISDGIEELSIPILKEIVPKIMSEDGFKSLDEVREYL